MPSTRLGTRRRLARFSITSEVHRPESKGQNQSNLQMDLHSPATAQSIDEEWLASLVIRWKLSEQYISEIDMDSLPEEHAIRHLVHSDFPVLIRELTRLRPELDRMRPDLGKRDSGTR
jgi:hypothetical protein